MPISLTDTELTIGGWQVMQSWELPLVRVMAQEVTARGGDILEIGFGMGLTAREIIRCGCRTYTVIEAHPAIADMARQWSSQQNLPVTVVEGFWQDRVTSLQAQYDGILFDTFPLSKSERHRNHYAFIPVAPSLLRQNGVLTYYSDETVDYRTSHLRLLLRFFNEVKLIKVAGLQPFPHCEYWHHAHMVVPVARKVTL